MLTVLVSTQLKMKGCVVIDMFNVSNLHNWRIVGGWCYGNPVSHTSPFRADVLQRGGVIMDGCSLISHANLTYPYEWVM